MSPSNHEQSFSSRFYNGERSSLVSSFLYRSIPFWRGDWGYLPRGIQSCHRRLLSRRHCQKMGGIQVDHHGPGRIFSGRERPGDIDQSPAFYLRDETIFRPMERAWSARHRGGYLFKLLARAERHHPAAGLRRGHAARPLLAGRVRRRVKEHFGKIFRQASRLRAQSDRPALYRSGRDRQDGKYPLRHYLQGGRSMGSGGKDRSTPGRHRRCGNDYPNHRRGVRCVRRQRHDSDWQREDRLYGARRQRRQPDLYRRHTRLRRHYGGSAS